MSSTGGQDTTNILMDTEDCQAGYIRVFTTTNTEQEDFIQLTVSCEDYGVSDDYLAYFIDIFYLSLSLGCFQRNHMSL